MGFPENCSKKKFRFLSASSMYDFAFFLLRDSRGMGFHFAKLFFKSVVCDNRKSGCHGNSGFFLPVKEKSGHHFPAAIFLLPDVD